MNDELEERLVPTPPSLALTPPTLPFPLLPPPAPILVTRLEEHPS